MSLIKECEKYLNDLVNDLGYDCTFKLEKSKMIELGDYQINVSMMLAKKYNENPREIAEKIVNKIDDRFTNINIAGPGFINLTLNYEYLIKYLNNAIDNFDELIDKNEEAKTIVLDYGGANIAKELHVGHLRCNIGEAVRRLGKTLGDNTISDVHWGDWGTPIGLVMCELRDEQPDLPYFNPDYEGEYPSKSPVTNAELGIIYPKASIRKKEDENFADEARKLTEGFQHKRRGLKELWQHIVNVSKEDCNEVYDYLNCKFDYSYGESDADYYVDDTLKIIKDAGVCEESDGALIMQVKEDNDNKEMPPLLLVKKDGAILYDTTELATIYQRVKDFNPDGIWYFTDQRQALHFEQTFRGAKKAKIAKEDMDFKFCGFGTINGSDGRPFKTRDGGVMTLRSLIKLVYDTIEPKIKEDIQGDERIEVANKLTVATLKYSDLLPNRGTDYIFDVDKFTSFDGKTGIYAVYTATRIKSLLNKFNCENVLINSIPNDDVKDILVKTTELSNVLTNAYKDVTLSYVCEYIYELSSLFNKFYTNNNISNEKNKEIQETYLAVSKLTYTIISKLLNILAIDEVEKM